MKNGLKKYITILVIFMMIFSIITPVVSLAEGEENTMIVVFANATIDQNDNKIITFDDGEIQLAVQFLFSETEFNETALEFCASESGSNAEVKDVLKDELDKYNIKITNTGTVDAYLEVYGNISLPVGQTEYRSMADVGIESNGFIEIIRTTNVELSNILWDYDKQDAIDKGFVDPQGNADCLVEHGKVNIVSVTLPETNTPIPAADLKTYTTAWYGKKYNYDANITEEGTSTHAVIPVESKVTVELIPDAGYQVTRPELNGTPIEPDENLQSTFTFTMPQNPLHLQAIFEETSNISDVNDTDVVNEAEVEIGKKEISTGTVKLTVKDANISNQQEQAFEQISGDYTISDYLEIDLDQVIYKGTEEDYWSTSLTELTENATITLDLAELEGNDVVVLHEHEGNYEVLNAECEDNSITFETNSFSTYAIAYKTVAEDKKYIVNGNDCSIEFNECDGKTYTLEILNYLSLDDNEIAILGYTKEEYNNTITNLKNMLSDEGTTLEIIDIDVFNNGLRKGTGTFTFKIKLTDEMKKYDTFKFIYLDEQQDGSYVKGDVCIAHIEGEYLVVTLPHLSPYAIVGSVTQTGETTEAVKDVTPKTGTQSLIKYAIGMIISAGIGIALLARFIDD